MDKLAFDACAQHNLHGVGVGFPIIVQGAFEGSESLGRSLLLPPPGTEDVLAKLVLPGMAGLATLAPVEDEIFQLIQREAPRYVVIKGQ